MTAMDMAAVIAAKSMGNSDLIALALNEVSTMTQQEAGEAIGVSQRTMSRWRNGGHEKLTRNGRSTLIKFLQSRGRVDVSRVRKPVGVSYSSDGTTVAICDDGAVFSYDHQSEASGWYELDPIPGTERAATKGKAANV